MGRSDWNHRGGEGSFDLGKHLRTSKPHSENLIPQESYEAGGVPEEGEREPDVHKALEELDEGIAAKPPERRDDEFESLPPEIPVTQEEQGQPSGDFASRGDLGTEPEAPRDPEQEKSRFKMHLDMGGESRGKLNARNYDRWYKNPGAKFFGVFDEGANDYITKVFKPPLSAESAAQTADDFFHEFLAKPSPNHPASFEEAQVLLKSLYEKTKTGLYEVARKAGQVRATTWATGMFIKDSQGLNSLVTAVVGDSSVSVFRGGNVVFRSKGHSKGRSDFLLTKTSDQPFFEQFLLQPGDIVVGHSDGLSEREVLEVLASEGRDGLPAFSLSQRFVKQTGLLRGDDATAVVVKVSRENPYPRQSQPPVK